MTKTATFAAACMLSLCTAQVALADDTEIFLGAQLGSLDRPNIMFIFDTSRSMDNSVPGDTRDRLEVVQDVVSDMIDDLSGVNIGLMKFDYDTRHFGKDVVAQGGMIVHAVKPVESSRDSLKAEIDRMVHYGATPLSEAYYEAARYMLGMKQDFGKYAREAYVDDGDYETRLYPSKADSRDGQTYISPITGKCQRNYIVLLTDGKPSRDQDGEDLIEDNLLQDSSFDEHAYQNCSDDHPVYYSDGTRHGGGICTDELADFLYKNDLAPNILGKQNIITNVIGFAIDYPLLSDTAAAGGGTYYQSNDAESLKSDLLKIFDNVIEDTAGFTAPAVTVNAFDRTSHLDQLYFTVFSPRDGVHWPGNLKKYRFVDSANSDGMVVIGQDDMVAVDPNTGFFYDGRDQTGALDPQVPTAWSYWSSAPDGADVTKGGAAGQLTLKRRVLTYPGSGSKQLKDHPLIEGNSTVLEAFEAMPMSTDLAAALGSDPVKQLIKWNRGIDVLDGDADGETADARQVMGDPLHSKPAVVVYGGSAESPDVTLFVGTNDGFLHAFDGQTGKERFAYMPRSLWSNVPKLAENPDDPHNKVYGVDGPITIWKSDGGDSSVDSNGSDFVYLYFGLRRGGNEYHALDVTDLNNPKILWTLDASDLPKLGQTWSQPVRARMNFGTKSAPSIKDVLVFGGGYDEDQDDTDTYKADDEGNAIYVVDAVSGELLWSASNSGATVNNFDMVNAFPGRVAVIDLDVDGLADRMYANDVTGRMWRFDIHNPRLDSDTFEITAGVIAELGGTASADVANNRRFFYGPDVALGEVSGQNFLTITTSSGYRASPLSKKHDDFLFGVRDYKGFQASKTAADYAYDLTASSLVTIGSSDTIDTNVAGFKLALSSGAGEKALSRSRIFQNKAYYTTYTPGSPPDSNPCAPAVGSGRLYALDLGTGASSTTVLKKPGIPPEPTFIFGKDPKIHDDPDGPLCFGAHCAPEPPEDTCTGDDCPEDPDAEEESDDGRKIECLTGPESCDAGATEIPQRTYWRQQDPNQ